MSCFVRIIFSDFSIFRSKLEHFQIAISRQQIKAKTTSTPHDIVLKQLFTFIIIFCVFRENFFFATILVLFVIEVSRKIIFKFIGLFQSASLRFWAGQGVDYPRFSRNDRIFFKVHIQLLFYFKKTQQLCYNLTKFFILSLFDRCGCFPQVFGKFTKWLVLNVIEVVRVSVAVTCLILQILSLIVVGRQEYSNIEKTVNFQLLEDVQILSPRFWGRLLRGLY